MATVHKHTSASPRDVWEVLSIPETYAHWVVGAKEVRGADAEWPNPGSVLHHSVGAGAANIKDNTQVVEAEPERHLKLRGRVRPIGLADIVIDLRPSGDGTDITMTETVVGGPMQVIYGRVLDLMMKGRNVETLRRLSKMAEEGSA